MQGKQDSLPWLCRRLIAWIYFKEPFESGLELGVGVQKQAEKIDVSIAFKTNFLHALTQLMTQQ